MEDGIARKAAKWWADQLRGGAKLDNGDTSRRGGLTMAIGLMLQNAVASKRTPEQIQAFEDALVDILQGLEDVELRYGLGVDYHPDRVLQAAIDASGCPVSMTCLPWKTHMHIKDGEIMVACGYGAPLETI